MATEHLPAIAPSSEEKAPLALYLHIPFCTSKCGYCDFNSYEGLEHVVPDYTPALVREMELWAPAARNFRVETIFFGGGTPSLTSIDDMRILSERLHNLFDISPDVEWTLEANPTELTREHLEGLRGIGVNRLSMGVQSMHPDELELLERQHSPERVVQAVQDARAAGFDNMNLDLIFGLIGQPVERWQSTLEQVLAFQPEHLSCYALTVEPGTAPMLSTPTIARARVAPVTTPMMMPRTCSSTTRWAVTAPTVTATAAPRKNHWLIMNCAPRCWAKKRCTTSSGRRHTQRGTAAGRS